MVVYTFGDEQTCLYTNRLYIYFVLSVEGWCFLGESMFQYVACRTNLVVSYPGFKIRSADESKILPLMDDTRYD